MNALLEAALSRARGGAYIIPLYSTDADGVCTCWKKTKCDSPGKHPRTARGLDDASRDPSKIERWWQQWPDANVGVRTDDQPRIDIDDLAIAEELASDAELLIETEAVRTPSGGLHITLASPSVKTSKLKLAGGRSIGDLKASAAYVLVPPSRIGDAGYVRLSPDWVEPAAADDPLAWFGRKLALFGHTLADTRERPAYQDVGAHLTEGGRHDGLLSHAGLLYVDGISAAAFAAALNGINEEICEPPLAHEEVESIVQHFLERRERRAPTGAVLHDPAIVSGYGLTDEPLTDAGNGEYFARQYGDRVRYDHRRRRWLMWDRHRWSDDADGEIRRLAKLAVRHRLLNTTQIEDLTRRGQAAKFAIQSEHRQRLDALLAQAQTEPPLADAGTHWDRDPLLFATENGILDLRTGLLRDGRPEDSITLYTPVAFDAEAECPRWLRFLDEVFGGDLELVDFIQRAVGYSLTGLTVEQCLFLCYGTGANGKSVFLRVLRMLAGLYAFNAPFSLFEMHSRNAIPNDLAALVNRRLVTSSETNEGTRLNEARVKALTGCDPITARFMRAEFFTFDPVAKYWLAVNHKPTVADDSHGFWRRVRLIPFTQRFTGAADDQSLGDTLQAELPGILAWAVRGALRWLERGLPEPAAVHAATETYRIESDPLAAFIDERCLVADGASMQASMAFKAYLAWGGEQGMREREILTSTKFGARMTERFEKKHSKAGNRYVGIGLISDLGDPQQGELPDTEPTTGGCEADPQTEVKGWVKGFEPEGGESEVNATEMSFTRSNPESAFTTLHPFTETPRKPCRGGCGAMVPPSQKCSACADAAVATWKRGAKDV